MDWLLLTLLYNYVLSFFFLEVHDVRKKFYLLFFFLMDGHIGRGTEGAVIV